MSKMMGRHKEIVGWCEADIQEVSGTGARRFPKKWMRGFKARARTAEARQDSRDLRG